MYLKKIKKTLAFIDCFVYNQIVVTLIALKREVAVPHSGAGFPWSKCQVVENWRQVTVRIYNLFMRMNRDAVCKFHDTHGGVYSHHLSCYKKIIVRKGGGFFYGSKSSNANYIKGV